MKVALMQPYLFPYLGYFQLVDKVDAFVFYDDANYIKQGFINRNTILSNGEKYTFTWPVSNQSSFRTINQHNVSQSGKKIYKTFEQSYSKHLHWGDVSGIFINTFLTKEKNISRLAEGSVKEVCDYVDMKKIFYLSSEIDYDKTADRTEKIIQICEHIGATIYINNIGGEMLYDPIDFSKRGIQLQFFEPDCQPYAQQGANFFGALSVADILVNKNKTEVKKHFSYGGFLSN